MAPILTDKNGVSIYVLSREHLPPHIHAYSGDDEAQVNIRTGEIVKGYLPGKKLKIVQDWLNEGNNRALTEQNFYELNPRLKPLIDVEKVINNKRIPKRDQRRKQKRKGTNNGN